MDIRKVKRITKNKFGGGRATHYEKCAPFEEHLHTHAVIEKCDYDRAVAEYEAARKRVTDLADETQRAQDFAVAVQDELDKSRLDFEIRLAAANAVVEQAKAEAERQRSLNENLIRITKERANAKQGLIPKKVHTGYVLLSAEEYMYTHRHKSDSFSGGGENVYLPCWRVRLQTPYGICVELDKVSNLVDYEMASHIGALIGVADFYDISGENESGVKKLWERNENFAFKTIYRMNGGTGFWEVVYFTRHVIISQPEMLPGPVFSFLREIKKECR